MKQRLQKGQFGEKIAEEWFKRNGWKMFRTQPAIRILGVRQGKRYGTLFLCRMVGRGGIPDFLGYRLSDLGIPEFVAVEVKEASVGADSMPCSRLDREQRAFMEALPSGSAFVGILWGDGTFQIKNYRRQGSYKK